MIFFLISAFFEKKIHVYELPKSVWENSLNLSQGRITEHFVKWLVEKYLKRAMNTSVEKDLGVQGQFFVKDRNHNLLFVVRDVSLPENTSSKDYIKEDHAMIDKRMEEEGRNIDLIKKVFKRFRTENGIEMKAKKEGQVSVLLALEKILYFYPFTQNTILIGPLKSHRIYITWEEVPKEGKCLKDILKTKEASMVLEDVGKALALWHLKSKFVARVSPFDIGFKTATHGALTPNDVLVHGKQIIFLHNDGIADAIKAKGKSHWIDIKSFIRDLTSEQRKSFLKGYGSFFEKQGYTVENMEEFIQSALFQTIDGK